MLRFEILNKESVACREVVEDCLNIKDSKLFVKGVNTLLAINALSRLESTFYNQYKLDWNKLTKGNFSDDLIDLDKMSFDDDDKKAAFIKSWNQAKNVYKFFSSGSCKCPELNSKTKDGNYTYKTVECFTDKNDMTAILTQCAYYCMSMHETAYDVIYEGESAKLLCYHISGENEVFEIGKKYADSKDKALEVECKKLVEEIGAKFYTPEETDVLKKYSYGVKRKAVVACMDTCAPKPQRNRTTGAITFTKPRKKDLQKALACILFHIPLKKPEKKVIKEMYL